MKTLIIILAIILATSIIFIVAAPREFDGRKYIGRTWGEISRVDGDIRNVSAKGFAIKEKVGVIGNSIQINFSNDTTPHVIGTLSKKKIVIFDTTLISDELYISAEKEIRDIYFWPFGRIRIQGK